MGNISIQNCIIVKFILISMIQVESMIHVLDIYLYAQLHMGRKLRTPIPKLSLNLKPHPPNENILRKREEKCRGRNKKNRDRRTKNLEQLQKGQYVYSRSDTVAQGVIF